MAEWLRKMRNAFSKKESGQEELEDFILLQDEPEDQAVNAPAESVPSEEADVPAVSQETAPIWQEAETEADPLDATRVLSPEEVQAVLDAERADRMDETGELEPVYGLGETQAADYAAYAPKRGEDEAGMVEKIHLDLSELAPEEAPVHEEIAEQTDYKARAKAFCKKHKSLLLGAGVSLGVIVLISGVIMVLAVTMNPLRGYSQSAVARGNVIHSMNTSGTMSANAHYTITSLVAGSVVESVPEVGDTVAEGAVLYKLDDTEALLAVKRAQNQLDRSKAIGSSSKTAASKIYSTDSGTIQTLYISSGSSISAGQIVATIERADDTVVSVVSTVSGTVSSVSVSKGRSVSSGTLIATVKDDQAEASQKTNSYDQKSNELDLEAAQKQLENYTIKSPVTGVVVEKNAKVGDNVSITNLENPMMVIVDMNSMKFTFQVDEYNIWEIEPGQSAIVITDSIPNETFSGQVTRVASEGKVNEEGKTMFDVDVTVEEPGDLKAGMKVNAKIILASSTNVMYLPEQALMEADGQNALVLVRENALTQPAVDPETTADPEASAVPEQEGASDEELAFPWIEVPKGCKLVTVRYGIADGTNVEIISGLELGDIVVYDPKKENKKRVSSTATASPSKPESTAGKADGNGGLPSSTATVKPRATDDPDSGLTDEEVKKQIQDKVKENQNDNQLSL